MIAYYSNLKRKLIIGAVLVICGLFALLLVSKVSAVEGDPYSMNEKMTYEADGLFIFEFTAEMSFDVEWYLSSEKCLQKPVSGKIPFYFSVTDFFGTSKGSYLINKDNLGIFYNAGNCAQTEHYIAGVSYVGYLNDFNHYIVPTDTIATIRSDKLRDMDEETNIDAESIFTTAQGLAGVQYTHDFYLSYPPTIEITYPPDESEMTTQFNIEINYSFAEDYEKIMIWFEDWDVEATCPIYGTPAWITEYPLYFNYQSPSFFSADFSTSTGTTTIRISGLSARNWRCTRCFMINESTTEMSSELCPEYNLITLNWIPPDDLPTYYVPITAWSDYYAEHSEFPTSTPLFDSWAGVFEPMVSWLGNTALFFQGYFDADLASQKGEDMGNAVATARGYLESIDNFFGGLPISDVFLFYLITAFVVIIYRLVRGLLTIIIP